ncbi:condensation domain-containing protein, partial [Rheinheimera gaetbuli]
MVSAAKLVQKLNSNGISITAEQGRLITKAAKGKLTAELAVQIREHKQELLTFLGNAAEVCQSPKVIAITHSNEIPLSFAQQRLWLLEQIDGGSAHYNMPFALRLCGALDAVALQRALDALVLRHEILRTSYHQNKAGEAYQRISPAGPVLLSLHSVTQGSLDAAIEAEANRPFDLSHDLMLRATVLSVSA